MKNHFIAFAAAILACLSSTQVHAQNTAAKISIYFDVAADSLDARSRFSLDSFARIVKTTPDAELNIFAYTDDRGSAEKNKALSTRRANAVLAHLSQHSISTRTENIDAKGEIELNTNIDLDTETQRQQNRRVEIRLTTFLPQNLTDFYDYEARKNTQIFNIDNKKANYIAGQKGGTLIIPANAFVGKMDKSAPALPIKIELREAYTFGDMILQNLTTTSNKNILQTGGMMYIAATDANGKALELKAGKEITIAMPMPQTPLDSMQIFLSDRAGDHNGAPTNWVESNTTMRNNFGISRTSRMTGNNNNRVTPCTDFDFVFRKSAYKNAKLRATQRVIFPKNVVVAPKERTLIAPKFEEVLLSQKDFKTKNPRQKREAKKAYKARYTAYTLEYQAAKQQHDADMAKYQQDKKAVEDEFADYNKYNDSLELAFFTLYKEHYTLYGVSANEHSRMESYMACAMQSFEEIRRLNRRQLSFNNDINRPEFADIRAKMEEYNIAINGIDTLKIRNQLLKLDSFYHNSVALKMLAQPFLNFYNEKQPRTTNIPKQSSAGITFRKAFAEFIKDEKADFSAYASQYIDTFGYKIETATYLKDAQDFEKYLTEIELEKVIKQHKHLCILEHNVQILYNGRKAELGELTDAELLAQSAGALAKISNLGWINCDRFYNADPQTLSNVIVEYSPSRNTQAFAIIPNMSSILPLSLQGGKYTLPGNGVPKNLMVKFVFIEVIDGKVKLAIHESASRPTNRIVPQFKACTPAQLAESLRNI
jgi:hypothetical protein